jgi:glycosyltransferase A (GT-A) superfamily protein (DUF2064 family)
MKNNVGNLDKVIRISAGLVSVVLGMVVHGGFYILAAALIITSFTGFCGIYALFGLSTCPRKVVSK